MRYKLIPMSKGQKYSTKNAIEKLKRITEIISFKEFEKEFSVFCQVLASQLKEEITLVEFYNLYIDLVYDLCYNNLNKIDHPEKDVLLNPSINLEAEYKMKSYKIVKNVFEGDFPAGFWYLLKEVSNQNFGIIQQQIVEKRY